MPLFSSIVFSSDVPDDVRKRLETTIDDAIGGRREIEVTVEDYATEDDVLSFTLSYCGKSVAVTVPSEYLSQEINSIFFYDEALFEEEPRLDYIYRESFSSVTLPLAKRGEQYALVASSGKTEALFTVDCVYEDAVTLKPFFLSSPLPGMKLERISDFFLSLRALSSFRFDSFGASLSLYWSTLCYPVTPFVNAAVIWRGGPAMHLCLGLSASFSFASVWPEVTFVRNLRAEGEFAFGLMYDGKWGISSEYAATLTWTVSRFFSLSAGVVNYAGTNFISLSLGGKL